MPWAGLQPFYLPLKRHLGLMFGERLLRTKYLFYFPPWLYVVIIVHLSSTQKSDVSSLLWQMGADSYKSSDRPYDMVLWAVCGLHDQVWDPLYKD